MQDRQAIVREWLVTDGTTLFTLVGTRIGYPVLPAGFTNITNGIAFQMLDSSHPTAYKDVDSIGIFKCYGGSPSYEDAKEVALTLIDRLQGANGTTDSGRIGYAALEPGGSFQGPNEGPKQTWPVHVVRFRIRTTE